MYPYPLIHLFRLQERRWQREDRLDVDRSAAMFNIPNSVPYSTSDYMQDSLEVPQKIKKNS